MGRSSATRFPVQGLYLRHLADQVRALGVDPARWLAASGLSDATLDGAELDASRFEALVRGAIAATGEPALGLLVGRRLGVASHGMVGLAAASSSSVREGLEVAARYGLLRTTLVSIAVQEGARAVRVRFDERHGLREARAPALEAIVLAVKNVFDWAAGGASAVASVAFSFPAPQHAELATEAFGCEVRYGASWTGFEFPAALLDAPLPAADPETFREASAACQRQLERLGADTSHAARVRRLLLDAQARLPSLRLVARVLHLSPRTLHRRLVAEGTSFHALVEEVRHAIALELLEAERLGLAEIAHRLGYSELASFRRAFKRWEGVAPDAWRRRRRGPGATARSRAAPPC